MLKIFPVETDEDLEIVKGLLEEYVASWFEDDGPVHIKEVEAHKHQMNNPGEYFGPPDGCLLVAKDKKEPAGCVALRKLSDETCEMKRLYVKPEFRGLKIGRNLANAVIAHARKIGYKHMRIHTITAFEQANRLYKSLGFNEIDPYEYTPREDAVFMELKLV
ncbi:MAG: GNAT family N-acetyltransferase [Planctomycetota bacterium]|jgi:GNAT superfamily N-acetyltransferase